MMRFIPLSEKYPEPKQIVLIKLIQNDWIDVKYYVVKYTNEFKDSYYFVEAAGEGYMEIEDCDILGWLPIEELDNIPI